MAEVNVQKIIKDLGDIDWGKDNAAQMKAVQLLKGLALSDDPKSNEFMKALSSASTTIAGKVTEADDFTIVENMKTIKLGGKKFTERENPDTPWEWDWDYMYSEGDKVIHVIFYQFPSNPMDDEILSFDDWKASDEKKEVKIYFNDSTFKTLASKISREVKKMGAEKITIDSKNVKKYFGESAQYKFTRHLLGETVNETTKLKSENGKL